MKDTKFPSGSTPDWALRAGGNLYGGLDDGLNSEIFKKLDVTYEIWASPQSFEGHLT